jgi:predicted nucleotidyltransferase
LSAILGTLQKLIKLFENRNISYMIIGGYALPFYGRIRSTIDIDIAVAIKTESEYEQLRKWLHEIYIEVTLYAPNNPVMVIVDRKEKVEAELWLKPDGITFNNETLKRRKKAKISKNINAWIISPEDFIINKLARPDRSAVDEQDVKSVLTRQAGKLDNKYLTKKAKQANVLTILQTIQAS